MFLFPSVPIVTVFANYPYFISRPCILVFDSMRSATGSRPKIAATLRDYLACEYRQKFGEDRVFSIETMPGCCPKVPQQPNYYDCGIYALQFIESFFKVIVQKGILS